MQLTCGPDVVMGILPLSTRGRIPCIDKPVLLVPPESVGTPEIVVSVLSLLQMFPGRQSYCMTEASQRCTRGASPDGISEPSSVRRGSMRPIRYCYIPRAMFEETVGESRWTCLECSCVRGCCTWHECSPSLLASQGRPTIQYATHRVGTTHTSSLVTQNR